MKRIKQLVIGLALVFGVGVTALPVPAHAINVFNQCNGDTSVVCQSAPKDQAPAMVKTVIDVLLFILGIVAVIMIIIGGLRYVLSGGDSGAVTGAKNTILYAVIGLVVAIMAYAIVHFVTANVK